MLLAATLLLVATAAPAPDLTARFTSLLERDELRAVVAAAGPDANMRSRGWAELRDTIVKYDCIDVHDARTSVESSTDDTITVRIELDATGVTFGEIQEEQLLPPVWIASFARDGEVWRMTSARTRESLLVDELYALPDDRARWERLRLADYDLTLLAKQVAYRVDERPDLWPFARELGAAALPLNLQARNYAAAFSAFVGRDIARATEYANTARQLAEESRDLDAIARAAFTQGTAQWVSGDIDAAARFYEESASFAERLGDPRTPLLALHNLGHMEFERGNVTAAAMHARRAGKLSRRYGFEEGEVNAIQQMGLIHGHLGNHGEWEVTEREVVRKAAAIGYRESLGAALYNLALDEITNGRYAEAEALLRRAAAAWSVAADLVPARLGDIRRLQGRLGEAERHYREALAKTRETRSSSEEVTVLWRLSDIAVRRGRPAEALALADEAMTAAQTPDSGQVPSGVLWRPHFARGNALAAAGRRAEAAAAFLAAVDLMEAEASNAAAEASPGFLDNRLEPFFALMRLHVEDGAAAEALAMSDRMKARMLRDIAARGHVDLNEVLTAEERAEHEALNARVVERNRAVAAAGSNVPPKLRQALDEARRDLRTFAVRVHLAHPELRAHAPPPDAAGVREWLDTGRLVPDASSAVLDYVVGDRETTLFILTRDARGGTGVHMATIPLAKKELAARVGKLMSAIERRDLGYAELAEDLHRRLVLPAASRIAGKTKICIVPHSVLWQLPFAVLRGEDGRALIETHSVHYAPSLAYLAAHEADAAWLPEEPRVLALGDPAVDEGSLSTVRALTRASLGALPEAAEEARAIGRIYPRSTVLLHGAATEEAVKERAARQDILHFATHGISQAVQPLYSSLVLAAETDREDGLLEAREVVRMKVPAQLAVLSACETARGGISEGEGVIGLSWAFLAAGCPRTVVTQWRTDSAAAAEAMVRFHRRVAGTKGGGSIAAALREAQLALARTPRYSHPYYWGGFVAVGAGW